MAEGRINVDYGEIWHAEMLTAINDLNEPDNDGTLHFYRWNSSTANRPVSATGAGVCLHYATGPLNGVQLALFVNTNSVYTRVRTSGTWGAWQTK